MAKKIMVFLIIGAVLLRLVVAFVMGDRVEVLPGIFDQVSYHTLAIRLVEGHGFTFETDWWPLTKAGEPTAHWSYLYTLYLAGLYTLVGIHPLVARVTQAILVGTVMPLLAFRLGRQVLRDRKIKILGFKLEAALIGAAWVAFYGYYIYYGAALMTESFFITGILWTLDCALRIAHSRDSLEYDPKWRWLELGLAMGVSVLLRQVFLLFIPFLLFWIMWVKWQGYERQVSNNLRKSITGTFMAVAVTVMMILPFTIHNYQQFGKFVFLNTNAGYAFYWANHPIHGDQFVSLFTEDMPSYQELIPIELSGLDEAALEHELMARAVQFVVKDPWRYIKLSLSRVPDQFIFWPLSESSMLSNLTRVGSIGIALPFMIVGIVTWIWDEFKLAGKWRVFFSQAGILLLLFGLVYTGVHLLSWAGIRYRLPTDAVGLIFAAGGVTWILNKLGWSKA